MKNLITSLGFLLLLFLFSGGPLQAGEPGEELALKVYPNPSNGEFTIEFKQEKTVTSTARIYDMTGKLVKDFKDELRKDDREVHLNVRMDNPTSGIYFLKIESGKERITRKIMIR